MAVHKKFDLQSFPFDLQEFHVRVQISNAKLEVHSYQELSYGAAIGDWQSAISNTSERRLKVGFYLHS